jgi:hypothetical protein
MHTTRKHLVRFSTEAPETPRNHDALAVDLHARLARKLRERRVPAEERLARCSNRQENWLELQ